MRRPAPRVSPDELAFYRTHFREALREDAVLCLECGALFRRDLNLHLRVHGLTAEAYKEAWGYNRKTALITPSRRDALRQQALAQNLPAFRPSDSLQKAQQAVRSHNPPRRQQMRLDHSARVRARLAAGWQPTLPTKRRTYRKKVEDHLLDAVVAEGLPWRELLVRSGLSSSWLWTRLRALGLTEPRPPRLTTSELLALCQAGLWPQQIAARAGMPVSTIRYRIRGLRRRGIEVLAPTSPRPNPMRRVSDDALIELTRAGLGAKAIAARVGIRPHNVTRRLQALQERGILGPALPEPTRQAAATCMPVNDSPSDHHMAGLTQTCRLASG